MVLDGGNIMNNLMGKPIGVSFKNGQGTSGVLCGMTESKMLIVEYLYHEQFALKQYDISLIENIHQFPPCHN